MGKKEDKLILLISKLGKALSAKKVRFPTLEDVRKSEYSNGVEQVYRLLGGELPEYPLRLRKWDVEVEGFAIELDEQLHFNRYRQITLESKFYDVLNVFPLLEYKKFCRVHEQDCLQAGKYGGKWSNRSCEKQFGLAGPLGDLSGLGAPRWKQRAFYDFVKDLSPLIIGVDVVRLSIWDVIEYKGESYSLKDILECDISVDASAIWSLVESRV